MTPRDASAGGPPLLERAFYAVSDADFFPGAVALLNSLRLVGHDEPFFLVDVGLERWQRAAIASEVELLEAPLGVPPMFLKAFGPLARPAGVAIILDADVLVVRPLTELIETAATGRLVAFVNNPPNHDRFFPAWAPLLGLGSLRRQPYLASGQLFVPHSLAPRLLGRWQAAQAKVDISRTLLERGKLSDPFYFPDMDALNAIAAAELTADQIVALENRLAPVPPFAGLRLLDEHGLVCSYDDGAQPFLLHHILAKPWLKPTRSTIYSTLLSRLLLAPDVRVRLQTERLPRRLRTGWRAVADRRRASMQALAYAEMRAQLGRFGIRTRLARARARGGVGT